MAVSGMMQQGLVLMALGMGGVFLFLGLLVAAMAGMSRIAAAMAGSAGEGAGDAAPATPVADEAELIAVIGAAVHRYRQGS